MLHCQPGTLYSEVTCSEGLIQKSRAQQLAAFEQAQRHPASQIDGANDKRPLRYPRLKSHVFSNVPLGIPLFRGDCESTYIAQEVRSQRECLTQLLRSASQALHREPLRRRLIRTSALTGCCRFLHRTSHLNGCAELALQTDGPKCSSRAATALQSCPEGSSVVRMPITDSSKPARIADFGMQVDKAPSLTQRRRDYAHCLGGLLETRTGALESCSWGSVRSSSVLATEIFAMPWFSALAKLS